MERKSPADMQAVKTIDAHTYTTPTTVTMATTSCSDSTMCSQAPLASLSILPSDQQAVRVIQHTVHRPQSMAAQYLHHMYAAQQQHLMLQTAALQQSQYQHKPPLQRLTTIPQAPCSQRQLSSPSSTDSTAPPAGVAQTSITLPASSVTAHLIGRSQTSNSTATAATVSQQAMLLGNRPANCNQAQMYLRTQMLILTPAAPVAAVHSELPAFSSCSTLPTSSEVHNLSLQAHLPGALATANSVVLKPTLQTQVPFSAATMSKTSVCAVKTNRMIDEADHPGPQTLNTLHTHTLDKKQLSCPSGQQVAHHQLVLQHSPGALNHKHLHPIALKVAPQEPNCQPLSLSIKRLTTPSTQAQTNADTPVSSSPASSSSSSFSSSSSSPSPSVTPATISSAQNSVPAATVQSQPPPLVAAPKRQTSIPQAQNQPPPPPPPLVLHRLPPNPPASLQRFSLHSVHAMAVQTGQRMRTEQELSIAEALNLMPYQNLPPPQTVAVDLKVHVVGRRESSSVTFSEFQTAQECKGKRPEEKEGTSIRPQKDKTPEPVTVPSKQNVEEKHPASTMSSQVIKIPQVERSASLSTSISHQPPPSSSPPLPTSAPPTAVRSPTQVTSAPTSLPGSPDRMCTSSVLTHLIEGFVIREGLEPFPVNSSSLSEEQQASLPEPQQIHTNGNAAAEDSPVDADLSESSDSEMENGGPPAEEMGDGAEAAESTLLQCEYCGSRGYAQTFLRSRRFCSMTCVRRFNVSCTKRVARLRGHWSSRPLGRRGRPPSRMNVAFLRRAHGSYPAVRSQPCSERDEELQEVQEEEEEEQEEEHPAPMKTRLQKMAERQQERESEWVMPETICVSDGDDDDGLPSQWNVEQVFSYIYSLPGGAVVAEEFRSQEIDGQALLLLTEDHLVSTMNLKLGPALKLCAQIQSLKDA